MDVTCFLKSLLPLLSSKSGREEAAAQVEGSLHFDGAGATLAPAERQKLVAARLAIMAGKRPDP